MKFYEDKTKAGIVLKSVSDSTLFSSFLGKTFAVAVLSVKRWGGKQFVTILREPKARISSSASMFALCRISVGNVSVWNNF